MPTCTPTWRSAVVSKLTHAPARHFPLLAKLRSKRAEK
jgi:hypothetical protein